MSARRIAADVAVVGAGPAGIAAAAAAAEAGRRVVVLDNAARAGGQIWRHTASATLPRAARGWLERLARSGATVLHGAEVVDAEPGFRLSGHCGGAAWRVDAGAVILATGARERCLPFPGWTLPGVVGIGGAQALAKSGASFQGKRIVIAGSGPLLLPVAALLARQGARVALVAEQAPGERVHAFALTLAWRAPGKLAQAARYRAAFARAPYRTGSWAVRAEGEGQLSAVTLTDGRRRWTEPCDLLATGYGLVPNTELARLLGCELVGGFVAVDAHQRTRVAHLYCAGEPTGVAGVEAALREGEVAGLAAAGRASEAAAHFPARDRERRLAARMEAAFALRPELRALADADTIVCRCEDVRMGQLEPAWCARQAKLYTRAGMGSCQGRVCGPALEHLFGWQADRVRPPLAAAPVGALLDAFQAGEQGAVSSRGACDERFPAHSDGDFSSCSALSAQEGSSRSALSTPEDSLRSE